MMARNRHWLTEPVPVPRGIALAFAALAALTVVDWVLRALLWILQAAT